VVSRDVILDAVWPGVTVGNESVDQAVSELRRALGTEGPRLIRTISRAGYMLDVPAAMDGSAPPALRRPIPDRPVLAVLPLEVLGDAEEARWIADGIADDLITALGRWGWFPVIARQSSFAWRGTSTPAEPIAAALGARYLVEGSVRRLGRRLRVTMRLVEGESGQQLWSSGAEWPVARLFEAEAELLAGPCRPARGGAGAPRSGARHPGAARRPRRLPPAAARAMGAWPRRPGPRGRGPSPAARGGRP
jgi:TolB-like protein